MIHSYYVPCAGVNINPSYLGVHQSTRVLTHSQIFEIQARLIKNPVCSSVFQLRTRNQSMYQWIGLRENLQETMVFTIKYRGFL